MLASGCYRPRFCICCPSRALSWCLMGMSSQTLCDRLFPPERAGRAAVLYQHAEIIYEELRASTVRAAEILNALGIGAGDRVAILLNDSPEFIASFVAIISLGAIAVPINLALRREDQLFILKDCGACAAIVEAKTVDGLSTFSGEETEVKNLLIVGREAGTIEIDIDSIP